jgi:predicted small lipoprotein YifL
MQTASRTKGAVVDKRNREHHLKTIHIATITAIAVVSTLAGCGGGGGDAAPVAATAATIFPVDAAVQAFLTSAHSFNANYTDPTNKDLYTLAYSYVPGGDSVFEGKAAKTANFAVNIKKNGATQGTSSQVSYFQIGPVKSLGATLGTGEYIVAGTQLPFPATGKVGDVGTLGSSTSYTSASKTSVYATTVNTWELQADTASTAYLCLNSSIKYTNGTSAVGAECYKINTSGAILGNKLTITINGQSATFSS